MARRQSRGEERRREMERLLEVRRLEGLTYVELSRRTGIPRGTLAWWGSRLGSERPGRFRRQARAACAGARARLPRPRFTEVSWNGQAIDRGTASDGVASRYVVVLATGQRLLLPGHFDARRVGELVRELESPSC